MKLSSWSFTWSRNRSTAARGQDLFRSLRHRLDPLDLEILEGAFESTCSAVKDSDSSLDFDSDENLELLLRRELIEIACFNGVNDPESLRDILLSRLPHSEPAPQSDLKIPPARLAVNGARGRSAYRVTLLR